MLGFTLKDLRLNKNYREANDNTERWAIESTRNIDIDREGAGSRRTTQPPQKTNNRIHTYTVSLRSDNRSKYGGCIRIKLTVRRSFSDWKTREGIKEAARKDELRILCKRHGFYRKPRRLSKTFKL